MERYQFINSLAKKAGVNESESRLFAEIFLQKVYELIQPGDGIKLNGVGTAYYAKTLLTQNSSVDKNNELIDVIVFDAATNDVQSKSITFTIPAVREVKLNPLDKFFSLSPAKPVVLNSDSPPKNFINPPAADEIESLLNSKTEKLLADYKVIKNYVDPGLVINQAGDSKSKSQNNFNDAFLDEELDSILLTDIKDEELLKELESISWELDNETIENPTQNKVLPGIDENVETISADAKNSIDEKEQQGLVLNEIDEQPNVNNLINETADNYESPDTKNENIAAPNNEFERVKPFSSEFSDENPFIEDAVDPFQAAIDKVTREIEQNENNEVNIVDELNSTEQTENEFVEVIPKSTIMNSKIINVIEEEVDTDSEELTEDNQIDPDEYHREALKEATSFVNERRSRDATKEKKRSTISLAIIILILLLLSASIYIYLKYIKAPEISYLGGNGGGNMVQTSLVDVIERNYELPVTYPYPDSRRNSFLHYNGIDSVVFASISLLNSSDSNSTLKDTLITNETTAPLIVDPSNKPEVVRIKNNIYQYGKSFVVQVASFKSRSIAENESLKYNRKGLQSYIEEVEIPGRGIWYRLRIGNFLSVTEAENFTSNSK